jgi:hypothetical protein
MLSRAYGSGSATRLEEFRKQRGIDTWFRHNRRVPHISLFFREMWGTRRL